MAIEIHRHGEVVAKSRNLRGLLTYARKSPVKHVYLRRMAYGYGGLFIEFENGATCKTEFASFTVCRNWLESRRSWQLGLNKERSGDVEYTRYA